VRERLADDDRARVARLGDQSRVGVRDVLGEDLRAVGGAQPGGVIEVLDGEREPFQRARLAARVRLLGGLGLAFGALEVERDEGAELRAVVHTGEHLHG